MKHPRNMGVHSVVLWGGTKGRCAFLKFDFAFAFSFAFASTSPNFERYRSSGLSAHARKRREGIPVSLVRAKKH